MPTPKAGYYLPDGTRVPGTTTVIGRFKDSAALMHWAFEQGKTGKPTLYSEAEKAADIGTTAHRMVELHINGEDPEGALIDIGAHPDFAERSAKSRNAFTQYLQWAHQSRISLISKYQELQLVSLEHRFGGTPDAIGTIDGYVVLLDWKSSNAVYSDHLIQLAAYGHLIKHGVRVDNGELLNLEPSAYFLLRFSKDFPDFEFRRFGELDSAWRQFLLYREAYDNDRVLRKRAA